MKPAVAPTTHAGRAIAAGGYLPAPPPGALTPGLEVSFMTAGRHHGWLVTEHCAASFCHNRLMEQVRRAGAGRGVPDETRALPLKRPPELTRAMKTQPARQPEQAAETTAVLLPVVRRLFRRRGQEDVADDLAQEGFVSLYARKGPGEVEKGTP